MFASRTSRNADKLQQEEAMIDAKKYRVGADAVAENVDDEDVIYHGAPLDAQRIEKIVSSVPGARNLVPGGKSLSGNGKH